MKKFNLIIAILLLLPVKVFCQEMSVQSFYLAETDLTANTPGTMREDQNGDLCALIKVETSHDGFSFDPGQLGVRGDIERVGGELWVYVPASVKKMTISHAHLGVIRDYKIPVSLSPGRTYIMKIISGNVRTIVDYAPTRQFIYVELNPKDAIFELDGKIKATDDGVYQEMLPFGKYQYRAYAQNYYEESGVIEISDPDNTHNLSLNLRPAFGHLSILENAAKENVGAAVYIDDKYIGRIPVKDVQLSSGTYRLKVIKEMYEAYNDIVEISDGGNRILRPSLVPDFAEVTLVTGEGFDIYINGENKGKTSWRGSLSTGSYLFETRQKGHVPYKMTYDVTRNDHAKTIQIQEPTPLYGSLVISSTPAKAKIYIDGQYVGNTPKLISKQVVGDCSVSLELDGYAKQTKSVTVSEGQESSLSFTLKELLPEPVQAAPNNSVSTAPASQELSITGFYLVENDLTANMAGTKEYDANGNVCALIKVETSLDNPMFDVGVLGFVSCKRVGNEIWLYVPSGIRRITIKHPKHGVVSNYAFPCAIERGRTYKMNLSI